MKTIVLQLCVIFIISAVAQQLVSDPNFQDTVVVSGLMAPTDYAFVPDGRIFFASKSGVIQVYKNGAVLATPLIDISSEVQNAGDKGLLSIAIHPLFSTNGYLYLFYAVLPDGTDAFDEYAPTFHRITRYTVNGDVADTTTRKIILGQTKTNNDGLITCDSSHTDGKMRFAPDNSLMFSFGDGAHWQYDDLGGDTRCVNSGLINSTYDVGSFRSQILSLMNGKLLRIDPNTGAGLTDNPFYDPADPIKSRVWALGLRNSFRWSFKPTTDGTIVILLGDVGFATWEELNEVFRGDNLLWPCYEGPNIATAFQNFKNNYCQSFANYPGAPRFPLMSASHVDATQSQPAGQMMNAITGAVQYSGLNYPASYKNAIFYSEYARSFVSAGYRAGVTTGAITQFKSILPNALSAISIDSSPLEFYGGDLVYLQLNTGEFHRITYNTGLPNAVASALPIAGAAPLSVQFSADGSFDIKSRTLGFAWDFGDGATSDWPNPNHIYTTRGRFNATLTITVLSTGASSVSWLLIRTDTTTPVVKITNPTSHVYNPGDTVQFQADISQNPTAALLWDLQLVHNGHYHPDTDLSNETSPTRTLTVVPTANERFSLRMYIKATNADGIFGSDTFSLYPSGYVNHAPTAQLRITSNGLGSYQMDGSTSFDPDGDVLFYQWSWGDGSLNPPNHDIFSTYHNYNQNGDFTVTLIVSDNWGGKATTTQVVHVTGLATVATTTPQPTTTTPAQTTTTPAPTTTTPAPTTIEPTVAPTTVLPTLNDTKNGDGGLVTSLAPSKNITQSSAPTTTRPATAPPTTDEKSSAVTLNFSLPILAVVIWIIFMYIHC